jgi:hypothetical protein
MRNPEPLDGPSPSHDLHALVPDLEQGHDSGERSSHKNSWIGVAIIVPGLVLSIAWFVILGWGALRLLYWLVEL